VIKLRQQMDEIVKQKNVRFQDRCAATSLGALGLLGWRRKRKAQTAVPWRDVAEYRKRAEDCRQQALKLATKPHHFGAFVEMAQTWEQLADLHELSQRLRSSGVLLKPRAV
jgi:hypothetical protein